jgi:diguanylate cyclase (GGDEF)-like protein/PAS domain S-box-containing protein
VATRLFRTYLAGGAIAIVAYFLTPYGTQIVLWDAIVLSMPIAIAIGVRRFHPTRTRAWLALAAGLALFALGDVIWNLPVGGGALGPSDVAYTAGYPTIVIGCLLLTRGDTRTWVLAMVDALIGAVGLAVIVWVVVLREGVAGSGPTFAAVVNASYPVFDIVIVTLLVRIALADRSRGPAYRWLVGGFAVMLATDLSYAWLLRDSADAYPSVLDLGWLAGYVAIGAAPLHPGMVRLTHRASQDAMLSPVDVLWLGVPLFAVPILLLLPGHDEPVDRIVLAAGAIAIAALVMVRIVSSAKDRDRAHREARTAEIEYRAVFDGSPVAVLKVADGGDILEANPAAERLFDVDGGVAGRHMRDILLDERDAPAIRESVEGLVDGPADARVTWDVRVRRGDGSSFEAEMTTSLVTDTDGGVAFGITVVEDVTTKRQEEEHLRFRALHDPLTGLPNRDLLDEGLRRALARARRGGTRVAVMFLDLDGFKDVNDRMGHAAGDELLRALAARLEAAARGGDIVGRLGGDEFVIVVEDVRSDEQAEVITARFLAEVGRPVVLGGAKVKLGASMGLVVAEGSDTADEALRRADSAMYEAKHAGRGGWRRFGMERSAGRGA